MARILLTGALAATCGFSGYLLAMMLTADPVATASGAYALVFVGLSGFAAVLLSYRTRSRIEAYWRFALIMLCVWTAVVGSASRFKGRASNYGLDLDAFGSVDGRSIYSLMVDVAAPIVVGVSGLGFIALSLIMRRSSAARRA